MSYSVKATSTSKSNAEIIIKSSEITFGITPEVSDTEPNPAELLLGSLSACILKNVERFSNMMKFEYSHAEVTINATRLDKPSRMDEIKYDLTIYTSEPQINLDLLKKNLEKFGTIFNTLKSSCTITGELKTIEKMDFNS